jgi:cell division protein FtsB
MTRVLTWAAVIMALMSLPLLINFVGRVQDEQRMAEAVQKNDAAVQKSEIRNAQLRSALEYAKSDAFTERYAREQMHYAKAGEVLVLPSASQDLLARRLPWWQAFVTVDMTPAGQISESQSIADKNR